MRSAATARVCVSWTVLVWPAGPSAPPQNILSPCPRPVTIAGTVIPVSGAVVTGAIAAVVTVIAVSAVVAVVSADVSTVVGDAGVSVIVGDAVVSVIVTRIVSGPNPGRPSY